MNRKLKRFIALVLCVTITLGIDNKMGATQKNNADIKEIAKKDIEIEETETEETETAETETEETETVEMETEETETEETETAETETVETETEETETAEADTDKTERKDKNASQGEDETALTDNRKIENDIVRYTANDAGIQLSLATELQVGGTYFITSYKDWEKLRDVSHESTLEGMTFIVYKRESRYDDWTLNNIKIGCEEFPFSGTIYNYYSTTTIYSNTILFDYLSSKAHVGVKEGNNSIKTFILSYTGNVPAGLANNLVLAKEGCDLHIGGDGASNYYIKVIKGNINSAAEAGGLFANVYVDEDAVSPDGESLYKISIEQIGIDLSGVTNKSVTGKVAGGLIGSIRGDIDVNIISLPVQLNTVTSTATASGSVIGSAVNGVDIVFSNTSDLTLSSFVTGTGYVGGFIGYLDNAQLKCDKGIIRSGNTSGTAYVGGLIGYAYNSSCIIANYTQNNKTYIYQNTNGSSTSNRTVGGVLGKYYNDNADQSDDVLDISYIKTQNKRADVYSEIKITAYHSGNNKVGGMVGIIDSGNAKVHIHDINTDTEQNGENSFNANLIYNNNSGSRSTLNETGGIAGVITGSNIVVENIVFNYVYNSGDSGCYSNSLSGAVVGNIAARVGWYENVYKPSKLIVKDIKVVKNYVRDVETCQGGLFGYVGQSAVALQGDIDLTGVPYRTYANSSRASTGYVLLASLRNRGFVAGNSVESLIYLDMDANYKRPVTYDEDGIIKEFNADAVDYYYDGSTNARQVYCIDDIGNWGSLFRNVENVLDITKDIDSIVTGSVEKENGKYVIDSLGDALRLAVAGNTVKSDKYPRFGGNCFANGGEGVPLLSDILSGHFIIKADLKLADAGIHGFVLNDSNITAYPFTGTLEGTGDSGNPVITMDFISRQRYGGLFPYAENAEFKNLDIRGNIYYTSGDSNRAGAGSLAAYATGDISVDNVNIYTNMRESINNYTHWENGNMWCYGGMFGVYQPTGTNGGTFICNQSIIAPDFTIHRHNAHAGGMIGWAYIGGNNRIKKMDISGCTVATKISTIGNYNNGADNNIHGRTAGLISMVSDSFFDVGTTENQAYAPVSVSNNTYGNINITNMNIDGAEIDYSNTKASRVKVIGGVLGYAWSQVEVNISNLNIDNTMIKSRGYVGGLISYAAGKYDLNNISINSLGMENCQTQGQTYSGFMIGNGQNAFVTVRDYTIATDGKVTYKNYSNFDEIVGLNLRLADGSFNEYISSSGQNVSNRYINGGIVNIIEDDFGTFTEGTYKSYLNKVVTDTNKYTRYYYNLFAGDRNEWNINVSGNSVDISTPKQWLSFTVALYANSSIARFLTPYLNNTAIANINNINITADLDMKGYSIYPTTLSGSRTVNGNGHTIILYGEEVSDLEKGLKSGKSKVDRNNESNATQHYMMHASLFNEVSGTQTIQNLKLSGTAANIGADSGALIAGGACGNINIKDITLVDLRISHYKDTRCGVLISHIGTNGWRVDNAANVTFDGITTAYSSDDNLPAGAALIGYVGSDDAVNVKVTFKNMRLEDEKDNGNQYGKLFKYASYIYSYQYTNDLDANRCYILYTFTEDDCKNDNVTFGDEIKAGVQYYDKNRDKNDPDDILNIAIQDAIDGRFIPYVFTERNIFINPRNGNITEGCGTYEDPYRITNAKQFLTLYLYLTGKPEYETMFLGTGSSDNNEGVWKVVPIGGDGDGSKCSNNGGAGPHSAASYGTAAFPSRDDLRTAYYLICNDIELSSKEDLNDLYIGSEYSGLGSSEYPFAGVIAGQNKSKNYTISLPKQSKKRVTIDGKIEETQIEQSTVGLVAYMNGAVIKDIDIAGEDYDGTSYYNVTDCAGGVAARIVGGDNIIDNVRVSMNVNTDNPHIRSDGTGGINGIGGLVGVIDNGSLILRNIQDNKAVENCLFGEFGKTGIIKDNTEGDSEYTGDYNELVGMVVGRVYDGYVLYEGYKAGAEGEPEVLKRDRLNVSDKYNAVYPLVNGFHIINGNVLDSAVKSGRITFTKSGKSYNVVIKNGAQLETLALALNSDALSVYYCSRNDHITGYGYKSKCRRATYKDVGVSGAISSADRALAVKYDDNKADDVGYLYPYILYKYADYTALSGQGATSPGTAQFDNNNYEGYKTTLSKIIRTERYNNNDIEVENVISNVNKTISDVADYTTTYELESKSKEEDKLFDVSAFDISFRGIGAIYTKEYSDFRANFNGNGNYVKLYINRRFDDTIMYSGMFNELIYNQKTIDKNTSDTQLTIENFTIKNSIVYNPNKYPVFENATNAQTHIYNNGRGSTSCATGGLAGQVKGAWSFNDITLTRDEAITEKGITADVSGYKYVGGLIGRISNTLVSGGYNSAEFMNQNYPKSNNIDIVNCNVTGTAADSVTGKDEVYVNVTELGSSVSKAWASYRYSFAGGIVGGIGTNLISGYCNMELYGNINFKGCNIDRLTVTAMNKANLGGFAGMVGVRYNSDTDNDSGWGAIGSVTVDGANEADKIEKSNISNLNIISHSTAEDYSAGGIFGRIEGPRDEGFGGEIVVRNYNVENINIDNYIEGTSKTSESSVEGDGGVIGYVRAYSIDLDKINISGTNHIGNDCTRKYAGGLIGNTRPTGNNNDNYWQYKKLNTLSIDNCSVEGTDIRTNSYSCGGFVGRAFIEVINIGSEDTQNVIHDCSVRTGNSGSAGGIIGYIYGDNMIGHSNGSYLYYTCNIFNADINNMDIYNNGSNAGSGGVIGYIGAYRQSFINLKNIVVYGTDKNKTVITSKYGAGGIIGNDCYNNSYVKLSMQGYIGVGVRHNTGGWVDTANSGINIKSQYSGGIAGLKYSEYSEDYTADIMVSGNRIYSYIDNNNVQPETYSGGIFGFVWNYNNVISKYNKVEVKDNVILTGGSNNVNRNRADIRLGCGGLFGYTYNESNLNANANSSIYMPYITLENNSIGYYNPDKAEDKAEGWKNVTLESKEVQLYDASSTVKAVRYDKIDSLSDTNIGDYALAFGQFIGRLYMPSYSAQIFILRPKVKTDNTVGSIPVIDVGSNGWAKTDQSGKTYGEGEPYLYRKTCHIVYIDNPSDSYKDMETDNSARKPLNIDSSLLVNGKKEYHFGDFKDIISSYQNLNTGVTDIAQKNYNYIMSKRLNMYMPYNDEHIEYSLCTGDNNYYKLTYDLLNEEGQPANILNGVPVLILDGLMAQSVGDYAAAVLTNGGGVVSESVVKPAANVKNANMNNFWNITCKNAYIDTDGSIKPIESNDLTFKEHQKSSIYTTDSNRLNLEQSLYDEIIQKDSGNIYTITLLCYTYTCPCPEAGKTKTETVYIPVFVKEKVTMDSYIRILSNEEYSLNTASSSGYKDSVHVSHDSTYTIYSEFIYDSIRLKDSFKNNKVKKSLNFDVDSGVSVINKGTKFTLIDYFSGKSYYYTADGSENNSIPFEKFKDENGQNYEQCSIGSGPGGIPDDMVKDKYTSIGWLENGSNKPGTHEYENVGIERFFIVVELPDEVNDSVSFVNIKADAVDVNGKAVDEFFNKNPFGDKGIQITYIPGPSIGFGGVDTDTGIGTDGVTYIKGRISQDDTVGLDANVEVKLQDSRSPYWAEKVAGNIIDSANTNKYLEVAVTLLDKNNDIVQWPAGTNISFNGGPKQVLENNLIVYMYKDIGKELAMNTIDNDLEQDCYYYDVNENPSIEDMRWLHKDEEGKFFYYTYDPIDGKWVNEYTDITEIKEEYLKSNNQCNVTLDFSVADIEDYSGENYTVMMKLYRSDSPEYPNEGTSNSNMLRRQYSGIIPGESKKELAAAISSDNLMDLGINQYNKKQNVYDIPFTNKFDFSGLIHKSKAEADIKECADKKYMVTYRLYKKVFSEGGSSPGYDIDDNRDIANIISRSNEYQYEIMDWNSVPFSLYDENGIKLTPSKVTVNKNQKQSVIITTEEFTEDEIKNGKVAVSQKSTPYVTEWGMNLKVDTKDMADTDITNYMITATYVPYDKSDGTDEDLNRPANDQQQKLFDYFVFTIANLKTDF